jgi:hypothetical protein
MTLFQGVPLALILLLASIVAHAADPEFVIFNSIAGYKTGKPDLNGAYGLRPIRVLYAYDLWGPQRESKGPWPPPNPTPADEVRIKAVAAKLEAEMPGGYVMLDVEHWHTRAAFVKEPVNDNIQKLIKLADWVHQAGPSLKVGYFGVIPVDDYTMFAGGPIESVEAFLRDNQRIAALAPHVDVLFPDIYAITDNYGEWERWARTVLQAAKQYGKPVYPVLWPEYHANVKRLVGQFIPGPLWSRMLELCREYGNGAVIWATPNLGAGASPWNEDWPWWRETKAFLRRYSRPR